MKDSAHNCQHSSRKHHHTKAVTVLGSAGVWVTGLLCFIRCGLLNDEGYDFVLLNFPLGLFRVQNELATPADGPRVRLDTLFRLRPMHCKGGVM